MLNTYKLNVKHKNLKLINKLIDEMKNERDNSTTTGIYLQYINTEQIGPLPIHGKIQKGKTHGNISKHICFNTRRE